MAQAPDAISSARLRQGILGARQHLQQQRISRIAAADQREIMRRHGQRKIRLSDHALGKIRRYQPDMGQQIGGTDPSSTGLGLPVFGRWQGKVNNGGHAGGA